MKFLICSGSITTADAYLIKFSNHEVSPPSCGGQVSIFRNDRTVSDRQQALQPFPQETIFTLAAARQMYSGVGGKEFHCAISGHYRTQIFDFPAVNFHPDSDEPAFEIYASSPVKACAVSDLLAYFGDLKRNSHYSISPALRLAVAETCEKIESQQKGHTPVYLVIEEFGQLTPLRMDKGECVIWSETFVQEGQEMPRLVGGRKGKQFITAWPTTDGAWPEIPNNQLLVNTVLAGVRAGQQTAGPMRKHVDQECLVTDDGRYVMMMPRPIMSARLSTATPMDTAALKEKAAAIGSAIAAMEQDICIPHLALLFNAMRSDDYEDSAFQMLQYLQLWQSLSEAGPRHLGFQGKVRESGEVLAGNKSLQELTKYRDDIAHWWTGAIDESYLADLRRTVNELVLRKYF